jgi:hypothetical protein
MPGAISARVPTMPPIPGHALCIGDSRNLYLGKIDPMLALRKDRISSTPKFKNPKGTSVTLLRLRKFFKT